MTDRSTRATAPARRPRPRVRRARQSLAVTMLAVGLVIGGFAAPSIAADGEPGATVIETAAAPAPQAAADEPDLPIFCEPGQEPTVEEPCVPVDDGGDDVEPCIGGVDYNGEDEDGCGEPNGEQCEPEDYNGEEAGCGTPPVVVQPCVGGVDYNGPDQDGCGTNPNPGGGNNGGGNNGGGNNGGGNNGGNNGGGNGGGNNGGGNGGGSTSGGTTGGGGTSNGGLGTTLGQAEGSVPGSETATTVTACSDSVICQAAPAATSGSTNGLPDTGAAENSRQLLVLGFGLLAAGGLLLKPGRRGRHRLVGATA